MNATTLRTLCLLFAVSLLAGCSSFHDTWKDTKKLYKEYVNTPTTMEIKGAPTGDAARVKLARLFMPADEQLEKLLRLFSAQDVTPPADWCRDILDLYPWLAGIAVVDTEGRVAFRQPGVDVIPTNFEPLLASKARFSARKMAGAVDVTELGPLVYIAAPLFRENEWTGMLVAYFDPRALAKLSPSPSDLIIVSSEGVLWPGGDEAAASALAGQKWVNTLKSDVNGWTSAGGVSYIWEARFVGNKPIIYMTSEKVVEKAAAEPAESAAAAPTVAPSEPDKAKLMSIAPAPTPPAETPQKPAKAAKPKKAKAKIQEKTIAPEQAKPAASSGEVKPLPAHEDPVPGMMPATPEASGAAEEAK